jgi:hypothetical protein
MFCFGKKVESFFTKVQKYFPKKRIYSHTFFEEETESPRWVIPDAQSLVIRGIKLIDNMDGLIS